jgi:hypothetical protein
MQMQSGATRRGNRPNTRKKLNGAMRAACCNTIDTGQHGPNAKYQPVHRGNRPTAPFNFLRVFGDTCKKLNGAML